MAIQTKATWARLKVGILALVAMAILAVLIFLITGNTNIFESNATVYTFMADAAALTTGAPVNLDGIPIGKVKTITLSGSKDPKRLVRLDMQLPEHHVERYSRIHWPPSAPPMCSAPSTSISSPAKATPPSARARKFPASTPANFRIWCSRDLA